jgi:hypothetical protein
MEKGMFNVSIQCTARLHEKETGMNHTTPHLLEGNPDATNQSTTIRFSGFDSEPNCKLAGPASS